MPDSQLIPVVHVASGEKFVNDKGITAIKDGVKAGRGGNERLRKPDWLRVRVQGGPNFDKVQGIV
ncbi:MAG: lipoyl synthase, partial [Halioglobus sp.]|nr:lipoyl synthase [Halioglobus sp.]